MAEEGEFKHVGPLALRKGTTRNPAENNCAIRALFLCLVDTDISRLPKIRGFWAANLAFGAELRGEREKNQD
jgi:hypothetical protein